MITNYTKKIENRIHNANKGKVFINADFADIADAETIRRILINTLS